MTLLLNVLLVVQILTALAMIGLILIQHGKGADMGAAFRAVCSVPVAVPIFCPAAHLCWLPFSLPVPWRWHILVTCARPKRAPVCWRKPPSMRLWVPALKFPVSPILLPIRPLCRATQHLRHPMEQARYPNKPLAAGCSVHHCILQLNFTLF